MDDIFTYGNADIDIIKLTAQKHRKQNEKAGYIYGLKDKLHDVEKAIMGGVGKHAKAHPGLSKICEELDIKSKGCQHNALDDAMTLYKVCKKLDIQVEYST